jgi:hypothetical protein
MDDSNGSLRKMKRTESGLASPPLRPPLWAQAAMFSVAYCVCAGGGDVLRLRNAVGKPGCQRLSHPGGEPIDNRPKRLIASAPK